MARNFRELEAKMTPEARERVTVKAAALSATRTESRGQNNGENAVTPQITPEESKRRREALQRATRLNQSEGLEPTARMLALDERYISGELTFEEYRDIVRSW